jgi:hypothetical protein
MSTLRVAPRSEQPLNSPPIEAGSVGDLGGVEPLECRDDEGVPGVELWIVVGVEDLGWVVDEPGGDVF